MTQGRRGISLSEPNFQLLRMRPSATPSLGCCVSGGFGASLTQGLAQWVLDKQESPSPRSPPQAPPAVSWRWRSQAREPPSSRLQAALRLTAPSTRSLPRGRPAVWAAATRLSQALQETSIPPTQGPKPGKSCVHGACTEPRLPAGPMPAACLLTLRPTAGDSCPTPKS